MLSSMLGLAVLLTLGPGTEPAAAGPQVRAVQADMDPLRAWFNENRGKPRLIVLVSPT